MPYIFYSPKEKTWVEMTDEQAQSPEAQKYNPVPYTSEEEVKGMWPAMGLRKTGDAVEALPFRVRGKTKSGAFTNIHAAQAFKDTYPDAGEIEARVYDPSTKWDLDWQFQPLPSIYAKHKSGEKIATKGNVGGGVPFYSSKEEAIKKQVEQKVKEGGFGAADTAKVAGWNLLEGVSPFGGVAEAFPSAREILDLERAYRKYEGTDEFGNPVNTDPYYLRTAGATVLPQIAGALAPLYPLSKAQKGSKLAQKVASKAGVLVDPTRTALEAAGKHLIPEAAKNYMTHKASPAITEWGARIAPLAKGAVSGVGDTALTEAVTSKARGEEFSADPLALAIGGVTGGLGSAVPSLVKGRVAATRNLLRGKEGVVEDLRKATSVTPEEQQAAAHFMDKLDEVQNTLLPTERGMPTKDIPVDIRDPESLVSSGFRELGLQRPSMVQTRLNVYEEPAIRKDEEAQKVAEEFINAAKKGVSETIPEFTGAATATQKDLYTRLPGVPAMKSTYGSPVDAAADVRNGIATELRKSGLTDAEAEIAAENYMRELNLEKSPAEQSRIAGIPLSEPSFRLGIPPVAGKSSYAGVSSIPSSFDAPIVKTKPYEYGVPKEPVDLSKVPSRFDVLTQESGPLEGPALRRDVPEQEWGGVKPVNIPSRLAQKIAKKTMEQQVTAPITPKNVYQEAIERKVPAYRDPLPHGGPAPSGYFTKYSEAEPFAVARPKEGYHAEDAAIYERIHEINRQGNIELSERMGRRDTPLSKGQADAIRKATNTVMERAFGDQYAIPNRAKKAVLDVYDSLLGVLGKEKGGRLGDVKFNVKADAENLLNSLRATRDFNPENVRSTELFSLSDAMQQLSEVTDNDILRNAIQNGRSEKPAEAVAAFNDLVIRYLDNMFDLISKSGDIRADETFKKLSKLVKEEYPKIQEAIKDVRENDLNDMGRVMREYVMWNSFAGNVPVLGVGARFMASLNMLSHFGQMTSRSKAHQASNMLDNIVLAKNIEKLKDHVERAAEQIISKAHRTERLMNLRQVGRLYAAKENEVRQELERQLTPEEKDFIDTYESMARDIAASNQRIEQESQVQVQGVSELIQRLENTPPEQQQSVFDGIMGSPDIPQEVKDALIREIESNVETSP